MRTPEERDGEVVCYGVGVSVGDIGEEWQEGGSSTDVGG